MLTSRVSKKCIGLFLVFLFALQIVSASAQSYVVYGDNCTATLKNVYSRDGKLYLTYEYKNNSSKKECFSFSFGISVFQGGYECDEDYWNSSSKNQSTYVKDGAKLEVVAVYKLRDKTSLVDITTRQLFSWGNSTDVVVYFNPWSQRWGSKAEVQATATPKPTSTPKADKKTNVNETAVPVSDTKDSIWVCPSCGKELNSKFCPDCGTTSPTPQPTATPTPAPTTVPMDVSKPVENVTKFSYSVYKDNVWYDGIYTGEIVDGFPHGYGFFECDGWFYFGDWDYGTYVDEDNLYEKEDLSGFVPKTFGRYFDTFFEGVSKDGRRLTIPYVFSIKDHKYIESNRSSNYIEVTVEVSIFSEDDNELLAKNDFRIKLSKKKEYFKADRWYLYLTERTNRNKVYMKTKIVEVNGTLE